MTYNFSNFFHSHSDEMLSDFIEQYTPYMSIAEDNLEEMSELIEYYKKVLHTFQGSFTEEEILDYFKKIAKIKVSDDIPYIATINEILGLKNILLSKMIDDNTTTNILSLFKLFQIINNQIAYTYFVEHINKLLSINNIRINSMSDLIDKDIIGHYEAHLVWLTDLAKCVRDDKTDSFPELDDVACNFGKWLKDDAKKLISNNSKYKAIVKLHSNLHLFGKKIYTQIGKNDYHLMITYLEKCELISLSIGTELALIDNILINKRVTKDALTGALNRQSLKSIFESQYELAQATNNPFILAMCDLDYFKNINDTYGHVAGDYMLKLFVDTIKEHLRNSDIIIRYGGEEFIIMLPAINKEKAFSVLEKIRISFQSKELVYQDFKISTTVSIGMMEINTNEFYQHTFLDDYINIVDQKLYLAKKSGRNRTEMR